MRLQLFVVPCLFLLVSGCSSTFETRPYNPLTDAGAIEGVRYYEPKLVVLTYSYTALTNKDGLLIGTADSDACKPVIQKQELTVLPDFSQPRVIINKPSALSSGKLGVTLDKGLLAGVNSESAPVTGTAITALGTVAVATVGLLKAAPEGGVPACNAAPVISKVASLAFEH